MANTRTPHLVRRALAIYALALSTGCSRSAAPPAAGPAAPPTAASSPAAAPRPAAVTNQPDPRIATRLTELYGDDPMGPRVLCGHADVHSLTDVEVTELRVRPGDDGNGSGTAHVEANSVGLVEGPRRCGANISFSFGGHPPSGRSITMPPDGLAVWDVAIVERTAGPLVDAGAAP